MESGARAIGPASARAIDPGLGASSNPHPAKPGHAFAADARSRSRSSAAGERSERGSCRSTPQSEATHDGRELAVASGFVLLGGWCGASVVTVDARLLSCASRSRAGSRDPPRVSPAFELADHVLIDAINATSPPSSSTSSRSPGVRAPTARGSLVRAATPPDARLRGSPWHSTHGSTAATRFRRARSRSSWAGRRVVMLGIVTAAPSSRPRPPRGLGGRAAAAPRRARGTVLGTGPSRSWWGCTASGPTSKSPGET